MLTEQYLYLTILILCLAADYLQSMLGHRLDSILGTYGTILILTEQYLYLTDYLQSMLGHRLDSILGS